MEGKESLPGHRDALGHVHSLNAWTCAPKCNMSCVTCHDVCVCVRACMHGGSQCHMVMEHVPACKT